MMSMSLIVILFCVTLVEDINIARIDGEQDLVVYINGLPLMAGGAYNMPAYQQLWNVMTNQGEMIPASVRYEKVGYNGRLRVLNQPRVFHMRIAIVRTAGGGEGQRSGTNVSAPGTAPPLPPPLPPQPAQTLSTTTIATPSSPPEAVTQTSQTIEATTITATEATTSALTSSLVPDTSLADATTEVAASTSSESVSEESTTELPSSSSSASEAVSL